MASIHNHPSKVLISAGVFCGIAGISGYYLYWYYNQKRKIKETELPQRILSKQETLEILHGLTLTLYRSCLEISDVSRQVQQTSFKPNSYLGAKVSTAKLRSDFREEAEATVSERLRVVQEEFLASKYGISIQILEASKAYYLEHDESESLSGPNVKSQSDSDSNVNDSDPVQTAAATASSIPSENSDSNFSTLIAPIEPQMTGDIRLLSDGCLEMVESALNGVTPILPWMGYPPVEKFALLDLLGRINDRTLEEVCRMTLEGYGAVRNSSSNPESEISSVTVSKETSSETSGQKPVDLPPLDFSTILQSSKQLAEDSILSDFNREMNELGRGPESQIVNVETFHSSIAYFSKVDPKFPNAVKEVDALLETQLKNLFKPVTLATPTVTVSNSSQNQSPTGATNLTSGTVSPGKASTTASPISGQSTEEKSTIDTEGTLSE